MADIKLNAMLNVLPLGERRETRNDNSWNPEKLMNELATSFTPIAATVGGILIGISAVALLALNGRLAGISSLIGAAVSLKADGPRLEAFAFLAGLILGPLAVAVVHGLPEQTMVASNALLIIAGLCVGAGTAIGSGCTSGHGICGIARLSPRSIVATVVFVVVGAITVLVVRHLI